MHPIKLDDTSMLMFQENTMVGEFILIIFKQEVYCFIMHIVDNALFFLSHQLQRPIELDDYFCVQT